MSLDVNISEPDEFNCKELHTCLKKVADLRGFEEFSYHVDYVCGKGENYIANIFRVLIKGNDNNDNNFKVIVKTLINTTRQDLFHELHYREVKVYEDVLSKYKEIQSTLNEDDKLVLPECYYTNTNKGNEVIILEDMNVNGFEMDNKLSNGESLNINQVSAVIGELAKFHALSFVFEKQYVEDIAKVKEKFQDLLFQYDFLNKSKLRHYFEESFDMTWNLISDGDAKKKLEKIKNNIILEVLKNFVKPGKTNVLCHGDCWINNVLFKYEDTKPARVAFLDFQVMRYANPITDIIYFLYLCTDASFRSQHMNDLKNIYYKNLKSFLNLFCIDVNSVYSIEEFQIDFEEHLPYGLISALTELRIIAITPDHEAVIKGTEYIPGMAPSAVPGEVEFLKLKVNDVIEESVKNGVLDKLIEKINV